MKRLISLSLLAVGLVGFFGGNQLTRVFRIASDRYNSVGTHDRTVEQSAGRSYEVRLWVVDEETGLQQWPGAEAALRVNDSEGRTLHEAKVRADQAASSDTGGVSRAQNGITYRWLAVSDSPVIVSAALVDGDYVDVDLYRDMPEAIGLVPGVGILIGLAGLVLFLRSRGVKAKSTA